MFKRYAGNNHIFEAWEYSVSNHRLFRVNFSEFIEMGTAVVNNEPVELVRTEKGCILPEQGDIFIKEGEKCWCIDKDFFHEVFQEVQLKPRSIGVSSLIIEGKIKTKGE